MMVDMNWKRFSSFLGLSLGFPVFLIFRTLVAKSFDAWAPVALLSFGAWAPMALLCCVYVALLCCVYSLCWLMGWAGESLHKRPRSKSRLRAPKPSDGPVSEAGWNAWMATKVAIAVSAYAVLAVGFAFWNWKGSVLDGLALFITGIFSFVMSDEPRKRSTPIQFSLRMLFWWTTIFAICFAVVAYLPSTMHSELRFLVSLFIVFFAASLMRLTWEYQRGIKEIEDSPLDRP